MAIHDFSHIKEQYITIDKIPDFRSEAEKQLTPMSIYNHDKPDIALAERYAEEIINISGAWISLHTRIAKPGDVDEVWDEDADPTYADPIDMKAWTKPDTIQAELTKWGVDIPTKVTIVFPRAIVIQRLGARMLQIGDVVESPYNIPSNPSNAGGPRYFRILNVAHTGYFLYRWLYLECACELITGDDALRPLLKGIDSNSVFDI